LYRVVPVVATSRIEISIVIPTLDEATSLAQTLIAARERGGRELIVADGDSRDATRDVAARLADAVVVAPRGRAAQMNAGAAVARGDVLLFLHADTHLPLGFADAIAHALDDPAVVGGYFAVALDAPGWRYGLIGRLISGRSRLTGVATGDQAIFVRRPVFEALGGFAPLPLMEDIDLVRRLKRRGRVAALRERVVTSARRWERHGFWRTVLLMWTLRLAYYAGVSPETLARWYAHAR
jgi:rSAM/selenodomain-associated transferase 2